MCPLCQLNKIMKVPSRAGDAARGRGAPASAARHGRMATRCCCCCCSGLPAAAAAALLSAGFTVNN